MVFNQINQNVRNAQERRCSNRRTRPPLNAFPNYFDENFSTIPYEFTDSNGNTNTGLMSDRVSVILLPGAFDQPGSAPGQDQLEPITSFLRTRYSQYNFIKGHMWNQEIGGQGVTQNLVPLTSVANSFHKSKAEQPLKDALRDFGNFYNRNKSDHPDYDKVYGFQYVVEIENAVWSNVSEPIVPNSIHVQIFPVKCDISRNISWDNSIDIYSAINADTRGDIEGLSNGIWIAQNGVVQ